MKIFEHVKGLTDYVDLDNVTVSIPSLDLEQMELDEYRAKAYAAANLAATSTGVQTILDLAKGIVPQEILLEQAKEITYGDFTLLNPRVMRTLSDEYMPGYFPTFHAGVGDNIVTMDLADKETALFQVEIIEEVHDHPSKGPVVEVDVHMKVNLSATNIRIYKVVTPVFEAAAVIDAPQE